MIRMEVALALVVAFIAYVYFSAGKKNSPLHRTFSMLLVTAFVNLIFDGITVYTVSRIDEVSSFVNDGAHKIFLGSMVFVIYLFYQYIAILVQEETGKKRVLDLPAFIFLAITLIAVLFVLPVQYERTPLGNYSSGLIVQACYASVTFYLALCVILLIMNWRKIDKKKRDPIGVAMFIELAASIVQSTHPTWLTSGMGITLMILAFYLTLENPEILRAELVEQKMSMLYLKSQVNPHFLYNTLDTIRIQAQLNDDKVVADLLMRLVDFFRISIKVDQPLVDIDEELDLIEAYLDLMCYRYPNLKVEYELEPGLEDLLVPNFILQPLVENSLLHGLKNRGYNGTVRIVVHSLDEKTAEIQIVDDGKGFDAGKKQQIDRMLATHAKQAPRLKGNSIGLLNVQKRIKLLCGQEYGLSYTENADGGVTAHIKLPLKEATGEQVKSSTRR